MAQYERLNTMWKIEYNTNCNTEHYFSHLKKKTLKRTTICEDSHFPWFHKIWLMHYYLKYYQRASRNKSVDSDLFTEY